MRDDILLAESLCDLLRSDPEIEVLEQFLRSAAFRFVPLDLVSKQDSGPVKCYLEQLTRQLSQRLSQGSFLGAHEQLIDGSTTTRIAVSERLDSVGRVLEFPDTVARVGHELDARLRCALVSSAPQD